MNDHPFERTLESLGLTGQEAILHRILLEHGDLNGYEAAKESGISRSNAYHALASLVDKGFADRIDGESARYAAVAPGDLAAVLRRRHETALAEMLRLAPMARRASAPFLSVAGRAKVLEKMRLLVETSTDRVYVSAAREELEELRPDLERALGRGIRATVLSDRSWSMEGAVVHVRKAPRGQVRLIVDGRRVLTGELAEQGACVLSENIHLVHLIKDSLTHEIELARLRQAAKENAP